MAFCREKEIGVTHIFTIITVPLSQCKILDLLKLHFCVFFFVLKAKDFTLYRNEICCFAFVHHNSRKHRNEKE